MLGSFLVLLGSVLLQNRVPRFPRGKVAAECCALGLWQTTLSMPFTTWQWLCSPVPLGAS